MHPRNVTIRALSYSVIRISWEKPEKCNGIPAKYQIQYKRKILGGKLNSVDDISNNARSVDITNLTGFKDYFVRVSFFK